MTGTARRVSPRTTLWLIILGAIVIRVGIAVYLGDRIEELRGGTWDQRSYDLLAQRVADGYGFSFEKDWWPNTRAGEPTAHWSYLYTLALAGIYALFGHYPLIARLAQAVVVGLLMPCLVYRLGRRTFGQRAGLIAAAVTAVYLYFAHYAASLMTESLYIVGVLWTLDVAMRLATEISKPEPQTWRLGLDRRVWLGLELGLAMAFTLLLRQVIVVFLVLLVLWLLWAAWRRAGLRLLSSPLLAAGLVVVILILPWVVRNYLAFGQVTFMPNTNSGFAFYWSNHPIYGTRFEAVLSPDHGVTYQELIPPDLRHLNEAALDRALLVRGLAFLIEDPGRYLLLSLSRIPVYFLFWPTADSTALSNAARVLSFGLVLPFMVLGLVLAVRKMPALYVPRRELHQAAQLLGPTVQPGRDLGLEYLVLLLLFVVSYAAMHVASWANVRYRLPVDAILIIFAAYALDRLVEKVVKRGDFRANHA
jgi:4-amino-4-deoxy-L-arabinose transferase-like glycosyltransferase